MTPKQEMRDCVRRIKVAILNIEEAFSEGLGLTEDNCSDIIIEAEEIEQLAIKIVNVAADAEQELVEERMLAKEGGD